MIVIAIIFIICAMTIPYFTAPSWRKSGKPAMLNGRSVQLVAYDRRTHPFTWIVRDKDGREFRATDDELTQPLEATK